MNYATRLSGYNFTIIYRKGSNNANADVLSRYPVIPLKSKETLENCAIEIAPIDQLDPQDDPALFENLVIYQNRNPLYYALRSYLEDGTIPETVKEYENEVKSSAHLYILGAESQLMRMTKKM